jgi:hypothetical protein
MRVIRKELVIYWATSLVPDGLFNVTYNANVEDITGESIEVVSVTLDTDADNNDLYELLTDEVIEDVIEKCRMDWCRWCSEGGYDE